MFVMDLADIPLFSMLRGRLGYLSEKQKLIAQNVANASTPGYSPRDLKPFSFQAQVQLAATEAGSSSAAGAAASQPGFLPLKSGKTAATVKPMKVKDSETTLDGNSVVLEEEMMKLTDARMDYDAAVGFYQKSLDILKMATRRPGSGS